MEHIAVLRYCQAKTKAQLLAEVAAPNSRDHGLGGGYNGLCVAIEDGQEFDAASLVEAPVRYARMELDVIMTPGGLQANIATQGCGSRRTMWRMVVNRADIIGLADRVEGGSWPRILTADGVLLRRGASVISAEKVKL